MRSAVTVFFLIILLLLPAGKIFGQAVGFGCLGFVGGYAGYSYQRYNPAGLNEYINSFNNIREGRLSSPMKNFGTAKGYRIGLNFFRANLEGFILTTKGFYQFLSEKQSALENTAEGSASTEFELEMKNWGVGVDLGTSITKALSWKVIDAALLYNSASLTTTTNLPNAITDVTKYESENSRFGYSIGTGFILQLIDEYVSIEGLAGYTVFNIDKMTHNDMYLTVSENSQEVMPKLIQAGGFNAVIQFNIGFPL